MRVTRRRFIHSAGLAGLALATGCGRLPWQPQAAPASAPPRQSRLGVLGPPERFAPFREGLRELGYVEGQNLVVEYRDTADRTDQYAELATELVALPVDVIVTQGVGALRASKFATSTIPIVSLGAGADLVEVGLVDSLARPGGNLTGLTSANDRLTGKRLQLLTEAAAPVARVAVLYDANLSVPFQRDKWEERAAALGVQFLVLQPRGPEELEGAFEAARREGADALYVVSTALFTFHQNEVIALAAQHRLPAVYDLESFVRAGGLMTYLGSTSAMQRRAATYVDRILKGAKPADLPIEQPTAFDFIINLKTAQALGLTIPQHVLLQATEVIQ
jgi:putative ABC transport system substrate-binding protein